MVVTGFAIHPYPPRIRGFSSRFSFSNAFSIFSAVCDSIHALLPYHKTDLISVLCNFILVYPCISLYMGENCKMETHERNQ
jgi:hypothetical protein